MTTVVEYRMNKATEAEIAEHLRESDITFVPPLSGRVEINDYARKIASLAMCFEAWSAGALIGLVATYCNNLETRIAHITSVSVLSEWAGKGIAARLMSQCIEHVKTSGIQQISLEVARDNAPAFKLYEKYGFIAGEAKTSLICMDLHLKSG